jgi:prepilin-type N-terminal cleavage/methylation domain-containing protein
MVALKQGGFSLIELVIVMVIIGILSSVAVISLSGTTNQARIARQQATLGALKGAWGAAYAVNLAAPTCAQIAAQMLDPVCTSAASGISCAGVSTADGAASAVFGCTEGTGKPSITMP